jgi:thioredoxin 1
MAIETTDRAFNEDVLQSEVPVMVDFWAPWCAPCRLVGPIIDSVAKKMEGKAKVYKLNVDDSPETARTYGISGIPTILVFRKGALEKQFIGVQNEAVYLNALNEACSIQLPKENIYE